MNTIKITIPEGHVVDNFNAATGELSFKPIPKDVKERIKTFSDVLKENGIDEDDFRQVNDGLPLDEAAYRSVKEIVKAFNEGWVPDWTDSSKYKYYPWFKMSSPSGGCFSSYDYGNWNANSGVGSRLCFKSADLAEHAGKLFENIYKEFLTA